MVLLQRLLFFVGLLGLLLKQQRRGTGVLEDRVVPPLDELLQRDVLLVQGVLLVRAAGHRQQGLGVGLEAVGEQLACLGQSLPALFREELVPGELRLIHFSHCVIP
ncbi:hypothetical protein [Kribbella qitaiheensis]|uniref:hypothetical protein n=1 Tax=Kribbella qitaiheensis TaxID=1544730 RepID=UPI001FE489ED|nr:hypothetical protein [Kribbella qitaiheensis]